MNAKSEARLSSRCGVPARSCPRSACAARTSTGPFAGLGQVTGRYTFVIDVGPPTCANGWGKARAYAVRFAIASKGEINFELAPAAECLNEEQRSRCASCDADVHGHWGHRDLRRCIRHRNRCAFSQQRTTGAAGTETWTGTLTVPGLEYDVTARRWRERPIRRCKPRRVRSRPESSSGSLHRTTGMATLPVACAPRSGSRFRC